LRDQVDKIEKEPIKSEVWVGWVGAIAVAAITATFVAVTFAYANFETKEHSKERVDELAKQLDRIESKVDALSGFRSYRNPGSKER
jgi:hypothetical protein